MSRGKGKKADIYDHLQEKRPGVASRAKEWGQVAKKSYVKAVRDLLTLLVRSCGLDAVEVNLPPSELDNKEKVAEWLEEIQEFVTENGLSYDGAGAYPVIVKKFRKDYLSFWSAVVNQIKESILFQDYVVNSLKYWLIGLSGSPIRAFRHTATITGMELILSLAKVRSEIGKKQEKLEHQRLAARSEKEKATRALRNLKKGTTEQKKQRAKMALEEANKTLNDLQAKISEFNGKMKGLKSTYDDLLKGIFLVRFRDTVPEIRRDLIQSLGTLIREVYQIFLTNDYMKYLGIGLHDKDREVRLIAVTELQKIYSDSNHAQKLDKFTKFYKKRILDILNDVHTAMTCKVIELLIELANAGFLEEEEIQSIVLFVNSPEKSIRAAVGNFLKQCIFSEAEEEEPKAKKTKKKGKNEPVESKSTLNLRKLVDLMIELDLSHPYVVGTLMPKVDFLKDWASYIALLHDNDEDGLSEDDKICVARLFVLAVRFSCGEKSPFTETRDPTKVVEISGDLFKLLDMYQAEPKVLTELCILPQYVAGESLSKSIKNIVKLLIKVAEKANDDELLTNAVVTLGYLSSELDFKIAKDAFDQLQESLANDLDQAVIKKPTEKDLALLLKKLEIVFRSGTISDVDIWDNLSQIWTSVTSGDFPKEIGLSVTHLFVLSLMHFLKSIPDDEYGSKGALLVQRRDFLVKEIFEKNFLEPKELTQREAFRFLTTLLTIFGERCSHFRLTLPSQLIQDMCAYFHDNMDQEEDEREKAFLITEMSLPLQSWRPSTTFEERIPRFDIFEKFSITEVGSEILLRYEDDRDVIKKRVVHLARSYSEKVMGDMILRTVIKHFIRYTQNVDQVEEDEEDEQAKLYRQFTTDCTRLGAFYFGFKGGKEKEKEKGKGKEKEKEKEKGKETEGENGEDLAEEPEAEEIDLTLEHQKERRKALIQLIRNGITFLMEEYRERCDLIAGLVPFVRRLPTTDLEKNSSDDALSCVAHMEKEMKRFNFDETEEEFQAEVENINRFLLLLKEKAGLVELPKENPKGKEPKPPRTPKKTPQKAKQRETPKRSTPSRSAKRKSIYAEESSEGEDLELELSSDADENDEDKAQKGQGKKRKASERDQSDEEEEEEETQKKTKGRGRPPTKKRKANEEEEEKETEEEVDESEEEEAPKKKPARKGRGRPPAKKKKVEESEEEDEEESEEEEPKKKPARKGRGRPASKKATKKQEESEDEEEEEEEEEEPPKKKGRGRPPSKKRKARDESEEEEEEEPSKPKKRRKVEKPSKRRTRGSPPSDEESEEESEDEEPKKMSASAALKLMVEQNQASPKSPRQLRTRK